MTQTADVLILGLGAMGSAAFHQLSRRGLNAIGIDQGTVPHQLGSSHGETRIIRKAYFEHPDYVPLLLRSYEHWRDLESATRQRLYHECGLLIAGPSDGEAVPGARLSAERYGVQLASVPREEARHRFPWLRLPHELECAYEPEAGVLEPERCIAAQVQQGTRHGGQARMGERVLSWKSDSRRIQVKTDRDTYEAAALVITGGPWSSALLGDLDVPLEVVRKPSVWFPLPNAGTSGESPPIPFFVEQQGRALCGIPAVDGRSIKIAEHSGGDPVTDPDSLDRALQPDDLAPLQQFLKSYLPDAVDSPLRHSVCMYTLTPDRHFVVDKHPRHQNVVLAAGFSGHGFKFAPVMGEALADLATAGRTPLPMEFLKLSRLKNAS